MSAVWVLAIEHRHGGDMSAWLSEDKAIESLATYCAEYWDDLTRYASDIPDEMPKDAAERIRVYFDNIGDEYYSLNHLQIQDVTA